ncbi:MAG: TonB-dependent receptor, partial [Mediterranea sp.]|nr:TonB-dependent receptor [Mediterranea sp.]
MKKRQKKVYFLSLFISIFLLMTEGIMFPLHANDLRNEKQTVQATDAVQQQQRRTIKGVVTASDDKAPVVGANVWLQNTSTGAITDLDGNYSINVEGSGGVLIFSFMGYKKTEVTIGSQTVINVVLEPDAQQIGEVVVVGYGSQKKESVVGAISTLDATKLKVPGASISSVLAGQLAGIVAVQRSGEPGKNSAADFYIRGVSSFKGTTTPLVLIDGIERDIDLVDTDDIASFSILKDASASAVYGVRGANGVILITTKKGLEGKPAIKVRAEMGFTAPTKMVSMVNSAQWAELYNEATGRQIYSQTEIDKYRSGADPDLYPNVQWTQDLFKDMATNQRINLNLTGGGEIATYYISGSYYNEGSIYKSAGNLYGYDPSINYNKYNFRANVDLTVTKSTKLNVNLSNIYEKAMGPGSSSDADNIWGYAFHTSPNAFPLYYSDGTISGPSTNSGYNPYNLMVHSGYHEQFWNSAQALIGITQDFGKVWKPLDGLTANLKFSWDAWNTSTQFRTKSVSWYHERGRDATGKLLFDDNNGDDVWDPVVTGSNELNYSRETNGTMTTYLEGSLTYNRLFNDIHRIGGLFLYNHKILNRTQDDDKYNSLPYKSQGIAGRVTYGFKDTYLAEFNMGYTGSEKFAPGHRFGFFPAGAIGWVLSNESWFEPALKTVNLLKLKGSYGLVGNDDIGGARRWMYEPSIANNEGQYFFNYGKTGNQGGTGIRVGEVENLYVSWEKAYKLNIGLELGLFDKLKIQADYFREEREGIFLQRSGLPALAGIQTIPYVNIGATINQGFDGSAEYEQKIGDVFLTARANLTYNRNKLLNNDEPDWEYKYQNLIGKSFGEDGAMHPFGLIALGIFESQEEIDNSPFQNYGAYRVGDLKYQDVNGDGTVDAQDRVAIGYTNLPEIVYGFGATAQWKGFDLNLFFQGVGHSSFFLSGSSVRSPFSSGNMERSGLNADLYDHVWKTTNTAEQNKLATYPRLSGSSGDAGASNNNQQSTWWMRNSSFLRLKNFELGYTLPKKVMEKTFVKSLRLYVSGNNLITFSQFKLW